MRPSLMKICAFIAAILSAACLFGCSQLAQVGPPEVQAVNSVDTRMLAVVETDRIYDNILVNGIPVGGLTKEEAAKKLTDELLSSLESQKVIVKSSDKTWAFPLTRLGYKYEIDKAVGEAYSVARTGTTEERYDEITALKNKPYEIEIEPSYNADAIDGFLADIALEIDTQPIEPSFARENKESVFTPGQDGTKVSTVATKEAILALTDAMEGGEVALLTESVPPKFTLDDLMKANALIGEYSTPITGSASRDVNLTVASEYINGVTLYPGEVFSTNETIGPTTYERGYRNAPVIENGKLVDGMGGGVCQVSSTLYNAVLFSELEIVQRQNHSLVVGYIPIGRDATLAGDVIDFKFKNDTDYPIYIESYLEGKRLYVSIYGYETRPANRTIDFESIWISSTAAPPEKETPDPSLPLGERVVDTASLGGQVIDVYKKVFVDGALVDRTLVNRSSYRARTGEARVGTGEAVAPPAEIPVETPVETPMPFEPEPFIDNTVVPEWIDTNPQYTEPESDWFESGVY